MIKIQIDKLQIEIILKYQQVQLKMFLLLKMSVIIIGNYKFTIVFFSAEVLPDLCSTMQIKIFKL